jgi:ribonuclease J
MSKIDQDKELLFLPLGGSGEIGMNMNLFCYGGKWLMVDCGISFADTYLPGIDLIMPDTKFIEEKRDDLLGIIITHAHEDHVGAIAYLWPKLRCPIYATPFTMTLLKSKLTEAGLIEQVTIIEVPLGGNVTLEPFIVDFVTLTHSIPEPNALKITTPAGVIFHTGDWKLDPDPLVGEASCEKTLKAIGDGGVLAMICDSTNVFNTGGTGSERTVRDNMTQILQGKKGKIIVTTFSSNIARMETLAKVSVATGRKLCLIGLSLKRNLQAARNAGYLLDFPDFIDEEQASKISKDKIFYICTGCQGEARAAMSRIISGGNRHIKFSRGDTVVFSSKIIPGNDLQIARLHNALIEVGVEVITEKESFVHVSGHPGQKELKSMYGWIKPEIAVPVHGEIRHMTRHAEFATALGINQSIVPHNGAVIRLAPGKVQIIGKTHSGRFAVDGRFVLPDDNEAIVIRRRILYNGAIVVSAVLGYGSIFAADPHVTVLGVPDYPSVADDEEDGLIKYITQKVMGEVKKMPLKTRSDDGKLKERIRVIARKASKTYTGKGTGPVTTVNITRI